MSWRAWAEEENAAIRAAGRWREVVDLDGGGPRFGSLVSFASNDYLGLTQHPAVRTAAHDAIERWGTGSGSARLIVGSRPVHSDLEEALAAWKGTEKALLFPTGFAANLGVLAALGGPGTTIVSDELNHASIIDGCRLARAEIAVFRHRDLDHAEALLRAARGRRMLVTDTVFSMDGDVADLAGLGALCARYGALLVLDEAHAVLGPHPDLDGVEALRVGTLSKTLGSLGGFVAGPAPLVDLLRNRARPFIFTTAPTPADAAAALAALQVLCSAEGDQLLRRLRANVDAVRSGHPSPIVPIVVGCETDAVALSARLRERGLVVPAIRPPTVPPGTSRLRVTLSAAHTDEEVAKLVRALGELLRLIVVAGTGTGVGKTYVTCELLRGLRSAGVRAVARKPVQSFEPTERTAGTTDAHLLAFGEWPEAVCPPHRWYELAMAPPMAAAALGRPPFGVGDLVRELRWPEGCDVGLVETAGGVASPIAEDGDCADLARALLPDLVLLVADAGLGTISAVRLAVRALEGLPVAVLLNRFDPADDLHRRNRAWLAERDGLHVVASVAELLARPVGP